MNNIFLTGFMGAGKSTVGKLLADRFNCAFIDLDEVIVQSENRSISDIFDTEGEKYFRDLETALLLELRHQPAKIYATGGGLVVREENRRKMQSLGQVVYLRTGWSILMDRLQQTVNRPLVAAERDWDSVKMLWSGRQIYYDEADIIVDTDGLTPLQVAQKITEELTV